MRFLLSSLFFLFGLAAAITTPPKGALIVRQSGTQSGEYKTVSSAVKAAGTGSDVVSIFIYPGEYQRANLLSIIADVSPPVRSSRNIQGAG